MKRKEIIALLQETRISRIFGRETQEMNTLLRGIFLLLYEIADSLDVFDEDDEDDEDV